MKCDNLGGDFVNGVIHLSSANHRLMSLHIVGFKMSGSSFQLMCVMECLSQLKQRSMRGPSSGLSLVGEASCRCHPKLSKWFKCTGIRGDLDRSRNHVAEVEEPEHYKRIIWHCKTFWCDGFLETLKRSWIDIAHSLLCLIPFIPISP